MQRCLSSMLILLMWLTANMNAVSANTAVSQSDGQQYVVKPGDGLYKLGRRFFGQGSDYKKIIKAHNAKAKTDSRYQPINAEQGLEVGQLIWIPLPVVSKPVAENDLPQDNSLPPVSDYQWRSFKPIQTSINGEDVLVVKMPESNCEIRVWYNYQLVAIQAIDQRLKAKGMGLIERAKKAYQLRHNARMNGRYFMADKFEVAALKDRDNKKYGNPDGPTFEHLVAFAKKQGMEGDAIYQSIINSSGRISPILNRTCEQR